MKYDPNMAGKQELSTFEVQHKYLWNFMLHNPSCSQITFLFLKKHRNRRKTWKRFSDRKQSQPLPGTKAPAWSLTSVMWQFRPKSVSLLLLSPCLPFGFLVFLQCECEEQQSTAQEQSMPECCRSVTGNASTPPCPQVSWNCSGAHMRRKPGHRDGGIFIRPENTSRVEVLSTWLYIQKTNGAERDGSHLRF